MSQASNVEKEVMMMMMIIALGFVWFNNFCLRFFGYTRCYMLCTHTHTQFSISVYIVGRPVCWLAGTQPSTKTNAQQNGLQRQRQREQHKITNTKQTEVFLNGRGEQKKIRE